jgi:hypothetical protein
MNDLGPKMAFLLRVYRMTEAENQADRVRDEQLMRAGEISERDLRNRRALRGMARIFRARDDASGPPWPKTWRGGRDASVMAAHVPSEDWDARVH